MCSFYKGMILAGAMEHMLDGEIVPTPRTSIHQLVDNWDDTAERKWPSGFASLDLMTSRNINDPQASIGW